MSHETMSAERKFWRLPEMVEKLLPFLDPASTKELAEAHDLTLQMLEKADIWEKLIKRAFNNTTWAAKAYTAGDDPLLLAAEKSKALALAGILNLTRNSQAQLDLLQAICKKFPSHNNWNFVEVGCPFFEETHFVVSPCGFLLLEEVERELNSSQQKVLKIRLSRLEEPLLSALASRIGRQTVKVSSLRIQFVTCNTKEAAEAWVSLLERSQTVVSFGPWEAIVVSIEGELGPEGWAVIRRGVQRLTATGVYIKVRSTRKYMAAGRKQDMKAIWDIVYLWEVYAREENGHDRECLYVM